MLNDCQTIHLARKGKAIRKPAARKARNAGDIKSKWAFRRTSIASLYRRSCVRHVAWRQQTILPGGTFEVSNARYSFVKLTRMQSRAKPAQTRMACNLLEKLWRGMRVNKQSQHRPFLISLTMQGYRNSCAIKSYGFERRLRQDTACDKQTRPL